MYRNLSLGFLILAVIFFVSLVRSHSWMLEQSLLTCICLCLAYMTFFRSLSFKKWHNRELILGFYSVSRIVHKGKNENKIWDCLTYALPNFGQIKNESW